jgi:HAMP domain-containing protein
MILPSVRLQTRTLVLVIAAVLVPFGLLAVAVVFQLRSSLTNAATVDHVALVARIQAIIESDFTDLHRQISLLAQDHRVQGMKEESVHEALHNFLGFNESFLSIFVYDSSRTLRFMEYRNHYRGSRHLLGKRILELPTPVAGKLDAVATGVLKSGKPANFDYLSKHSAESQLLLMASIPSFTGVGPREGVLSCAIEMYSHEIQDIVDDVGLQGSMYCLILDRQNRVVAQKGSALDGPVVSAELPPISPETKTLFTSWMRVGNDEHLVTIGSLPQLSSTVIVGRPRSEVLSLMHRLTRRIISIALAGLVVAAACALALSRSLVGPILELTEGIRKVGDGATGHRIQARGEDELAQAAEAFNRMAAQLQKGKLMEQIWAQKWEEKPDA